MDDRIPLPQKLTLSERSKLTVTGVSEILSFDEATVVLRTNLGDLSIHGEQLKLKSLSVEGGQAAVEGSISALVYTQTKKGGWRSRLFG